MDIVVDLDDKKGKENNFVSELEPVEALGKACMLISCCLRCPDSRPWCSAHCCRPTFCTVVLGGINRFSKPLALWRWKWLEQLLHVLWNTSCPGSVCITHRWGNHTELHWGGEFTLLKDLNLEQQSVLETNRKGVLEALTKRRSFVRMLLNVSGKMNPIKPAGSQACGNCWVCNAVLEWL